MPYARGMDCDETLKLLGERIRSVRKTKRITQEGLAELADLNLSYMSEIERGLANVSLCVVNQVANALGIGVTELLETPAGQRKDIDFFALRQRVETLGMRDRITFMEAANGILDGLAKAERIKEQGRS